MKTIIVTIALLTLILFSNAQNRISIGYTEINQAQFNSCSKTSYLVTNPQITKQSGKLTIPVSSKAPKIFKEENDDENFLEFDYQGDIKGTKLSLVKRTDYNNEEFYLINRSTGIIDTLIGQPVFDQNMKYFASINNPATDKKQQIQVGEIANGSIKTKIYLNGKADTFLEDISCITYNSVLTKDNKGKYWKLIFKNADE